MTRCAVFLLLTLLISTSALAAPTYDIGITAGAAVLGDGGGTHADLGAEADYSLLPPLRAGLFYNYIGLGSFSAPAGASSSSASLSFFGLRGAWDLSAITPGLSAGAKVALGWESQSQTVGAASNSSSNTGLYIGPEVSWDVPLGGGFTLGAEVNWLLTPSSNPNSLNVLAAFRFWF